MKGGLQPLRYRDARDQLDDAKTGETRTPRDYQTAIKRPLEARAGHYW